MQFSEKRTCGWENVIGHTYRNCTGTLWIYTTALMQDGHLFLVSLPETTVLLLYVPSSKLLDLFPSFSTLYHLPSSAVYGYWVNPTYKQQVSKSLIIRRHSTLTKPFWYSRNLIKIENYLHSSHVCIWSNHDLNSWDSPRQSRFLARDLSWARSVNRMVMWHTTAGGQMHCNPNSFIISSHLLWEEILNSVHDLYQCF